MTVPAITQLAGDIYRVGGAEVYTIPSRTQPGLLRFVIRRADFYHCTCPATVTDCWHVRRVRDALAAIHDLPERTP